jgi:hypothetical protein
MSGQTKKALLEAAVVVGFCDLLGLWQIQMTALIPQDLTDVL